MTLVTHDQNIDFGPIDAPEVLAERSGAGVTVSLLWRRGGGRSSVRVDDARTGESFELGVAPGDDPLDVFHHPYAYAAFRGFEGVVAWQ